MSTPTLNVGSNDDLYVTLTSRAGNDPLGQFTPLVGLADVTIHLSDMPGGSPIAQALVLEAAESVTPGTYYAPPPDGSWATVLGAASATPRVGRRVYQVAMSGGVILEHAPAPVLIIEA